MEGNQIGGGVTQEVEEDREANVLEYENRSRIIVNESSKISERVLPKRSRLFTGGQSITFFDARLRTKRQFRMMKCKKLYHPKKSYVRIQIPRKGYFYRSYANLKVPGSSSCLPSRVEPPSFYHTERSSKVPVSRMAAASSQISRFYEKKLSDDEEAMEVEKMSQDESEEWDTFIESENEKGTESETFAECDFSESEIPKEVKVSKEFISLPTLGSLKYLGDLMNQELSLGENDKTANEGDVNCPSKKEEPAGGESVLSQYLGKCTHGGDFELFLIDQLRGGEDEDKTKSSKLSKCSELSPPDTPDTNGSLNVFENVPNTTAKNAIGEITNPVLSTPVFFESENLKTPFPNIAKSPDNLDGEEVIKNLNKYIGSFLMEDIDLHSEFENYLKAAQGNDGNTQTAKARTRNTLQKNHTNWSRENEVFSEETLYDVKISNFPNNLFVDASNSFSALCLSGDIISTGGTIQSHPRRLSSESLDGNLIDKLAASHSSGESGIKTVTDCLSRMSAFLLHKNQDKSNENFFAFPTEENVENDFKMADASMCNCDKLKTIKSENDNRQINNENATSKTSIKRSFGKTSFHSVLSRTESETDPTMWPQNIPLSQILLTLSNHAAMARIDDYERVFPLTRWPLRRLRKDKYKGTNSNVLFKNVGYSLSSESFRLGHTILPTDYSKSSFKGLNLGQDAALDMGETIEQGYNLAMCGLYMEKNTGIDDEKCKDLTLQDVTDIYNSVLDENDKITDESYNSDNNPIYSHVKDLLKEKKLKSDLSRLSCDINSKVIEPYVTLSRKDHGPPDDPATLAKYVNMFQAVLLSSLSINQISNLNSIISGVSVPPPKKVSEEEKKENKVAEIASTTSKNDNNKKKEDKKEKTKPKSILNFKESISGKQKAQLLARRNCFGKIDTALGLKKEKKILPRSPDPRVKKKTSLDFSSASQNRTNAIKRPLNSAKNQKNLKESIKKPREKQEKKKSEKTKVGNIELSSPVALNSILKAHLESDAVKIASAKKNLKSSKASPRKLLITVNLNGDKILVNSVTRINSSNALKGPTTREFPNKNISDLIIEGLHYKQNKKVPACLRGRKLQIENGSAKVKGQLNSKKTSSQVAALQTENKSRSPNRKTRTESDIPKKTFPKAPRIVFKLSDSSIPDDPLADVIYITPGNAKKVPRKKPSKKVINMEKGEEIRKDFERGNKVFQTFEYNQKLLKTQHPLEAIVEKSEPKLTDNAEKPPAIPETEREEVPDDDKAKLAKKSFKKLEKVDEILRQLFLNNPLFPKLLQTKLSTLFWELKNSKSAEIEETKFERQGKSLSGVKAKGLGLKEKSVKLPKTSKSVSDMLSKNESEPSMKDLPQLIENHLKNESDEAPFKSLCDSYCYIVNSLVQNKKLKAKKKLKVTKNIENELNPQEPEKAKEKEPAEENKVEEFKAESNSNLKDGETELQPFISETAVSKISEADESKKKVVKKTKNTNASEEEKATNIKKTSSGKTPKKKDSNNTNLHVNTEISTDRCSANVLCHDLDENASKADANTPKKITVDNPKKELAPVEIDSSLEDDKASCESKKRKRKIKPIKSEANLKPEGTGSIAAVKKPVAAKSLIACPDEAVVKRRKESPIVIHSSKMEHDDVSFPSLMIQSESGLKNQTAFPATKSQVKNWFKSNSDRKFFPGRIQDNADEQTPFVTFFLTPRQNENSGLTADQAKIITRERTSDGHKSIEAPKTKTKKPQEINGQISLENVEKFIEYMSKNRSKQFRSRESARRNKMHKADLKKLDETAKMAQQMKRCRRFLKTIMPQKNTCNPQLEIKKTLIKTKVEMEKERKLLKRRMIKDSKKLKLPKEEHKVSRSPTPSKAITQSKSVHGNSRHKGLQLEKKTTSGESKSNHKQRADERNPSHNKEVETQKMPIVLETKDNSVVVRSASQETKTKSDKNYALKKSSKKNLSRSCELLDFVKEVISTAPDTKTKKEVIEVIEDYSKTLQKTLLAKSVSCKGKAPSTESVSRTQKGLVKAASLASVEKTVKPKKPGTSISVQKSSSKDRHCKTFTIKIRCNSNGGVENQAVRCTKEIEKSPRKKAAQPSLSASPLPGATSKKGGNMNLLDSLVARTVNRSNSNELARASSIYFDAAENFADFTDTLVLPRSDTASETSESIIALKNYPQEQNVFAPAITYNWAEKTDANKVYAIPLKPSDIMLFSQEELTNECEEKIFNKIMNYLQTDDVNYAMILVEELLKKSKSCEKKLHNSSKMKNLLKGIESKSKTVIEGIEKGGWLQVLSLIEEVASVFYMEKKSLDMFKQETKLSEKFFKAQYLMPEVIESLKSLEKQVHRLRIFLNAVRSMSETGLMVSNVSHRERSSLVEEMVRSDQISYSEVTATLARNANFLDNDNVSNSSSYIGSIFSNLEKSYRKNYSSKGESEQELNSISIDSKEELEIHETSNAIAIPGEMSVCNLNPENKSTTFLNHLKEQTRLQRQYIHYLLSSANDPVHPEVQAIRNKVADRLDSLENAIMQLEASSCINLDSYSGTTRATSEEHVGKSCYSSSLAQTYSASLNGSKISELESDESQEILACRSDRNTDLKSSLNYLVFEGLRSFNKSYSTSFDVGPSLSEEPQ